MAEGDGTDGVFGRDQHDAARPDTAPTAHVSRPRMRGGAPRVVALTGVHGPVGAALVRRLDEDDRVRRLVLLDRRAPALPLRRATFHRLDLTAILADATLADVLAHERVASVIHAGFDPVPSRDGEAAHEIEVIGTRALLRALAHDVRQDGSAMNLVVVGTTMSYGACPDNPQYLAETAPLRGGSGYPFVADKVAVEHELARFRERTGLPTAVVRAAPTLGDSATLAARLLAPRIVPAVLGRDPLVQLLHIEDLVDAIRLAMLGAADGAFNVAGDGVLPLSTIIKLAGRFRAPATASSLRAALQTLWLLGIGVVPGAHVSYLGETFVADTERAAAVLGLRVRHGTRATLERHVALALGALGRAA